MPVLNVRTKELKTILQSGDFASIPSQLSTEAREAMYDAMYKADGTVALTRKGDFFAATHVDVKDTFAVLAFLLGRCVTPTKRGLYVRNGVTKKANTFTYSTIPGVEPVWCPSTQNQTWVMRTDTGHIVVTGNTWMRKNVPLQFEQLGKNPQQLEKIKDFINVPWNAEKETVAETVIPEQRQDSGYVPGPMGMIAQATGMTGPESPLVMNRLNLPINDINKIANPGAALNEALGPLVKIPIEYATGRRFNGGKIETPTGFARPSGLASVIDAATSVTGIKKFLPNAAQGYLTTVDVQGRPAQRDIASWLTSQIPTGMYGPAAATDDPAQPNLGNKSLELLMRTLGLSPDAISPEDQKFEAQSRVGKWKRGQAQRVLMER